MEGIESVSLDVLMDIYSRYLPVDHMPSPQTSVSTPIDTTTKKEEEEEEVESWNQETTSTNNSNRVVVPSTKSTVTTLHFQSGLSLPVSGTSRTREQVLKNNNTTTTTTTTTTLLHEVPSFHILKDEQRKKKAMKAVLESKTAASQALSSPTTTTTLEPLANAEQELLKHVRLIFPSALQIFNNSTNTTFDAELITLDPDFLSSNHTIFLRMANTIIQKEQQKITTNNPNKKSNGVFLKEKRLDQSFHDWPQWFKKSCLTSSSLSISSLLLAAIEVSIYKSYIQEKNKQQHKKKNNNTPKQKVLPELTLDPLHHHPYQ